MSGKPYPRRCTFYHKDSVSKSHIPYEIQFLVNGKIQNFSIPELDVP